MIENSSAEQDKGPVPGQQTGRDDQPEESPRLTVVGIGGSAGGLEPLQAFFDALPAVSGMAFVVVTHMAPDRESLLPEILQQHTEMPVRQVQGRVEVEPNHVYVIPPARRIVLTDTHLDVQEFEEPRGQRAPIDTFFRSLAAVHRNAVAIILSGGGTDGAVGVKAVKERGGLLMVQQPDEAEHESMPRAAIATGLVDVVLPVRQLAKTLVEYHENGARLPTSPDALTGQERNTVQDILTQVHLQTGHDFSLYKPTTLLRRIHRRMQLHGHVTLDAYLMHLRHTPEEAHALFNDLLIGVTNFFRDREAWEALAEKVIPRLFTDKKPGDSIRVWTIGCSTGEEAYSVAILLMEHAMDLGDVTHLGDISSPAGAATFGRINLQVFASDLDAAALAKARQGLYPRAIEADVSDERLNRFFTREGDHYRIRREVRDIVLFSEHNVLRDAPFSRLELISCRNLLIYLNRELQDNVFEIFHYALNPEGYLFLGSAETAERASELFHPVDVDKDYRLYRARPWSPEAPRVPPLPLKTRGPEQGQPHLGGPIQPRRLSGRAGVASDPDTQHRQALEEYGPPSILVNENYQILDVSETAGRYLLQPRGPVTNDLLRLVRPELQAHLSLALAQAFAQDKAVVTSPVYVQFNGTPRRVTLSVRPRPPVAGEGEAGAAPEAPREARLVEALVFFLEDEIASSSGGAPPTGTEHPDPAVVEQAGDRARVEQLEAEVWRLQERLQASGEQYATANEELKAANEELQSINEEYRSANEELETSKEELQSLNEELQTVNTELKNKLEEITHLHSDLENLILATNIAILFLDRDLSVRLYTPALTELFNIMPGDRGRPMSHLTHKLCYGSLEQDAQKVLKTLVPVEREIRGSEDRWFLTRLRPYRSVDDRIDGVVITFVDTTEQKETEEALRAAQEFAESIVHTVREGLLILKPDLTVDFANGPFYDMFGANEQDTVGRLIYELGDGQWNIPELRQLLEEILPENRSLSNYQVEHNFPTLGQRTMVLNARQLDHVAFILLAIEDITERRRATEELKALNQTLEERVRRRTKEIQKLATQLSLAEQVERNRVAKVLHDSLQQNLYAVLTQLSFLREAHPDEDSEAFREELADMKSLVEETIHITRTLSVELSPPVLHDEGLTEALGWLANHLQERFGLQVEIQAGESLPDADEGLRVLLYQTVRELLFNVVKHADTRRAAVNLERDGERIRISVRDRGRGFAKEAVVGGVKGKGLADIRHRLKLVGGEIAIETAPGAGTQVQVLAPLNIESR